jgi:NAD(P)-dependent dehydrogenase (short-subunit alcohol dehydrogenase family)
VFSVVAREGATGVILDIRCSSVRAGQIRTPIIDKVLALADDPDCVYAIWMKVLSFGRLGTTEEVAAICVYLATDESAFSAGSEVRIDGVSTI